MKSLQRKKNDIDNRTLLLISFLSGLCFLSLAAGYAIGIHDGNQRYNYCVEKYNNLILEEKSKPFPNYDNTWGVKFNVTND